MALKETNMDSVNESEVNHYSQQTATYGYRNWQYCAYALFVTLIIAIIGISEIQSSDPNRLLIGIPLGILDALGVIFFILMFVNRRITVSDAKISVWTIFGKSSYYHPSDLALLKFKSQSPTMRVNAGAGRYITIIFKDGMRTVFLSGLGDYDDLIDALTNLAPKDATIIDLSASTMM